MVIVTLAGVAVLSTPLRGATPSSGGRGPSTVRVPRDRSGLAPASAPEAPVPPPHRVVVFGDSLAASLLPGLEANAAAAGVELSARATDGCGMLTGLPIDPTGRPYPWSQACNDSRVSYQNQSVEEVQPDVVLWLSAAWDERDRLVGGTFAQLGTVAGDRAVLGLIDQSAQRVTATGARLVIVTSAPDRGSQLAADPTRNARLANLNRLLRLYAVLHGIQVVDLTPIVCPGGGPDCPDVVDGVEMRPDGYHIGAAAAPVVAQQLWPLLFGAPPPGQAAPDATAVNVAQLMQRVPSTASWSEISHPWRGLTP